MPIPYHLIGVFSCKSFTDLPWFQSKIRFPFIDCLTTILRTSQCKQTSLISRLRRFYISGFTFGQGWEVRVVGRKEGPAGARIYLAFVDKRFLL